MLYILGEQRASSAIPVQLTAELYRANPIETFDAAAIRAFTHGGVELLFYTAHCVAEQFGPSCVYEFERARIDYSFSDGTIVAHFKDGRIKAYGSPSVRPMQKLWSCIDAVRTGEPIACGIAAALPHTLCASAAYGPDTAVHPISGPWIRQCGSEDNPLQCVEGLADGFLDCFERGVMPSEAASSHMPWAQAGESTDLQTDRWSLEASDELPIDALRHHLNLQDDVTGDGSLEAALV
jgi:hypothetical protein